MPDSDQHRAIPHGLALGAGLGLIVGAVLFAVTQNPVWVALGIPLGAGLGVAIGTVLGPKRS